MRPKGVKEPRTSIDQRTIPDDEPIAIADDIADGSETSGAHSDVVALHQGFKRETKQDLMQHIESVIDKRE